MEFLSILIISGIFLYLWDWFSKKRLYDCSKIIPGPKLKPFVGNSLEFAGLQTEGRSGRDNKEINSASFSF